MANAQSAQRMCFTGMHPWLTHGEFYDVKVTYLHDKAHEGEVWPKVYSNGTFIGQLQYLSEEEFANAWKVVEPIVTTETIRIGSPECFVKNAWCQLCIKYPDCQGMTVIGNQAVPIEPFSCFDAKCQHCNPSKEFSIKVI